MVHRTFAKAIIFRLVVIAADFAILWFVFGDVVNAGLGILLRHVIQILMYWYHERVWGRHPWGIVAGVETTKRSLAKTVTFRLMTLGKDVFVILFFTAEVSRGLMGVAILTVANTLIYFFFERLWVWFKAREHSLSNQ
ncbi:MAG: DUF2061 domain-containing protein [Patescibacteria group bacterium]